MTHTVIHSITTNLFDVKTAGKMNACDFISMAEDLLSHPDFLPNCNVIFDHTSFEFKDVSFEDLQKIRSFHMNNEEKIGCGKSAIIVKAGLLDEWHKLWSHGEKIETENITQVFEHYDNAMKWVV